MGSFAKSAVLALSFFQCTCQAFIYDLVVMKKWNGSEYTYFIGLSDFHDKKHKANGKQLTDLQAILSKTRKDLLRVAFEDVGSPGVNHDGQCGRFFVVSSGGVLNGFANICKKLNLVNKNFEYRYCRVAALGPVLNNINASLDGFDSVCGTHVSALIAEVEKILREFKRYKDPNLAKTLYAQASRRMRNLMQEMQWFNHADQTVAQYIVSVTTPQTRLDLVKKMLTFDSVLFDLRVMHDVLHAPKNTNYLAVAGGSHITRIAKLLAKFGYQYVEGETPKFVKEYNLGKCLGCNIVDGKYCERPKPISIKKIADFL